MIHLRTQISELLEADATLTGLVEDRIYHQEAPAEATYPLVLFFKSAGTPRHTMDGPPVERDMWTVKAVALSSAETEPIADAIDDVMEGAELPNGLDCMRASDVNYPEPRPGKTYRHLGAVYRIWASE